MVKIRAYGGGGWVFVDTRICQANRRVRMLAISIVG